MQKNHHRPLLVIVDSRRPNVHPQAVLSLNAVIIREQPRFFVLVPAPAWTLWTYSAVFHGTANSGPGLCFPGRLKAPAYRRAFAIGNALVGENPVPDVTTDLSAGGFRNRVLVGCDNRRSAGCRALTGISLRDR